MKDNSIRKILIEYLSIQHKEYRIYQEKNVGSSICDLMLVTDKLIGYEIKSDSDTYERLAHQVTAYDKFFDLNYVVVGCSHAKSIEDHVPNSWGIIVVDESNIEVVREATKNKKVSRKKQLSMLWKLELKNILMKNYLPLFPQKSKEFLCEKIIEGVPYHLLGGQIATELLNRDYSIYDANDNTQSNLKNNVDKIELPKKFLFSSKEIIDCLSEENLHEFTLDKWMTIYKMAYSKMIKKENKIALLEGEKRTYPTAQIPFDDIEVYLGAPWIPVEILIEFCIEIFKIDGCYWGDIHEKCIKYEEITGSYHVENPIHFNKEIISLYGTSRCNAMRILSCTLNLRRIQVHDCYVLNVEETLAAIEKQKLQQEAFREWLGKDPYRRYLIEQAYNKLFADFKPESYDGSDIEFFGMNEKIKLFDYQKNAVKKIMTTENTLLSFDVGAGKTYIMIASAMEMRRSGLSRKNMFVVPNSLVGQWEQMFVDLYPKAKVLAVDPKSFTPEKRQKVFKQMKEGDYDGIIIAYSCFEMLSLSGDYLSNALEERVGGIKRRIEEIRALANISQIRRALENEIEYLKKVFSSLLDQSKKCEQFPFDELEINTLFVDEAHNFKNIPLRCRLKNVKGINVNGSNKCDEMLEKVRFVQRMNDGRGVVFATGTPLCNSISDAYAMQMYLQPEDLKKMKLERFDKWIKTFSKAETIFEIDVNARNYRMVDRFAKFFNLKELSKMFSKVAIYHTVDKDGLPAFDGYDDVLIEKSKDLNDYMQELYERTENIRAKNVDRCKDNMLKVTTDGRKAALSLNLVGKVEKYDEYSKIRRCVDNVLRVYNEHEGCSQLIFCDNSTPKGDYNVYDDLKGYLIERGVPPKEIAFVHTATNEESKVRLYNAVNAGKIRVLIGSTFKLGIGANVQTKLKAIHHLDVPWRPADMVQREGRILRRGNENESIEIYRYVVKGSFDSYSWQILETKQKFISQFLSGNNAMKSIEDFENDELNYAQVKAIALEEPLMKEYAEKENELKSAKMVLRQEVKQKEDAKQSLKEADEQLNALHGKLENDKDSLTYICCNKTKLIEECDNLMSLMEGKDLQDGVSFGKVGEFHVQIIKDEIKGKTYLSMERLGNIYKIEWGETVNGNKRKLHNFISHFDKHIEKRENAIAKAQERKNIAIAQLDYKSDISLKVKQLELELKEIFEKLSEEEGISS